MPHASDVTALLVAWSNGEQAAATPLMDAVYDELRRLAHRFLRQERRDHSLPATADMREVDFGGPGFPSPAIRGRAVG